MKNSDIYSLYKRLFAGGYGIWVFLPRTKKMFFNAGCTSILGYEKAIFPKHIDTFKGLLHPDYRDAIMAKVEQFCESEELGNSREYRFSMRCADGTYRWIIGKGFVLCRNRRHKATVVVGVNLDDERLTKALDEGALEHERTRFALEAGRDGLWDWNTESNEVYFSPRYVSMLGYAVDAFPQHVETWANLIHPEDKEQSVFQQLRIIESSRFGDLFECVYRLLAADSTYRWILGRGKVIRRNREGRAIRVVGLHTDITELRQAQDSLTRLINHDTLTQLSSRFAFDAAVKGLQRDDYPVSVIYGDIDGLKLVNDYLGHATGDALLVAGAELIQREVGKDCLVARVGGDEIAVLLPKCACEQAQVILETIQAGIERHNAVEGSMPLCISLGLACAEASPGQQYVSAVVSMADKAMLAEKKRSRQHSRTVLKAWIEKKSQTEVSTIDSRLR